MCGTCGVAREAAARAKKSPIGDYSLWFLIDSDGIPDGHDLELFNNPETDCLLLVGHTKTEWTKLLISEYVIL